MGNKILLLYATRCGSTEEIAKVIGQEIGKTGASIDVMPIKKHINLTDYKACIIGSAIRAGKCMPEALDFVQTHSAELKEKKIAYFIVCMTMKDDNENNKKQVLSYLENITSQITPLSIGLFAGCLDYKKLSFPIRLLFKAMKSPEGDFRNWETIRGWARDLINKL